MNKLRLAFAIVSIAAYWLLVCLPLTVLGFVVVPVALPFRSMGLSPIDGRVIERLPSWAWLWSNDQEGCLPQWYADYRHPWPLWLARLEWLTWRNSCNNLRFVRWLNPSWYVDEGRYPRTLHVVQFTKLPGCFELYWVGLRHRIVWGMPNGKTLLAGWKWDEQPQPWQRFGVGFGIRIKRVGAPIGDWQDGGKA